MAMNSFKDSPTGKMIHNTVGTIKEKYKKNRLRRFIKRNQPFPWIVIFSMIVNIPIFVFLIILTASRWSSDCSYIGGFVIIYIYVFAINILYGLYFHKTLKNRKPKSVVFLAQDCGLSSFVLYTCLSVILFIICEYLRRGTEFSKCYKSNSNLYHLLRAGQGMDIFFLIGFYIISFFNACCNCYQEKRVKKKKLPKFVVPVEMDDNVSSYTE
ncbi:hypothetical protein PPL_05434 [Heterostelium album PN500]|uniref:MARVEL domain-containing protein n=1 Tax=Heterostelium pallidum (strain ATCC 26659 / Pp 5 / PN500) TaxID=670386 RepID=D3BA59_HETP5|nr:hypothetical protein PPL_05434 [Heterostelium album PN500]EFA81446.1 hypothetical protein PPL_05434 [Heterostelium album PN500]|eukprot:XP_020433564.1 hypothetical protein PPL_05434 [Heterostelium album PN500]